MLFVLIVGMKETWGVCSCIIMFLYIISWYGLNGATIEGEACWTHFLLLMWEEYDPECENLLWHCWHWKMDNLSKGAAGRAGMMLPTGTDKSRRQWITYWLFHCTKVCLLHPKVLSGFFPEVGSRSYGSQWLLRGGHSPGEGRAQVKRSDQ